MLFVSAGVRVGIQIDSEAAQAPAELQYELMVNQTICCKTTVLPFDVQGGDDLELFTGY